MNKVPDEFEYEFIEQGNEIIRCREKQEGKGCIVIFLFTWLTIWSAGCVTMTITAIINVEIFLFFFMIPFWIAEVFVIAILYFMLKKTDFTFKKSELVITNKLLFFFNKKTILKGYINSICFNTNKGHLTIHTKQKTMTVYKSALKKDAQWLGGKIAEWAGTELETISDP